jgi:hypothetical protein
VQYSRNNQQQKQAKRCRKITSAKTLQYVASPMRISVVCRRTAKDAQFSSVLFSTGAAQLPAALLPRRKHPIRAQRAIDAQRLPAKSFVFSKTS